MAPQPASTTAATPHDSWARTCIMSYFLGLLIAVPIGTWNPPIIFFCTPPAG